jgi:uncharacterized protein
MSIDSYSTPAAEFAVELTPPPPAKPRVWTVFLALFVSLVLTVLVQAIAGAAIVVGQIVQGADPKELAQHFAESLATPGMFILFAGCAQLAFFLGAVIPAWLSPTPLRERLGLVPVQTSWSVYPLAALGSLFPLAIGFALATLLALIIPADLSVMKLYENITPAMSVVFVLFIAVVPGIVEELLFRGYVQRRLLERWRPAVAIGITSVLFALVHVMPHSIVAVLPLGIWFGVVAWKSGSVYPGMLCHAFVNGGVNTWRFIVKFGDVPEAVQIVVVLLVVLISTVCFFKLVLDFRKPRVGLDEMPVNGTSAEPDA